jgi:hypothetical protein
MSLWRDLQCEMQRLPLDVDTADRLLAGHVLPADAPPGYEAVASLLKNLRAHEEERVLRHEDTVPELMTGGRSPLLETMSTPRRSTLHRFKLAGAAVASALACTTGLAFAGSLPGAAQDIASSMLSKVGVTVPGPNGQAGTHPTVRGSSPPEVAVRGDTEATDNAAAENGEGKGAEISDLATTTELTGVEKGAAISTLASGGKSQAGQQGEATADHSTETGGASDGAATADEASGGHSSAGADNAAAGHAHQP